MSMSDKRSKLVSGLAAVSFEDNVFESEVNTTSLGNRMVAQDDHRLVAHDDYRLQPPEDRRLQRTRRHISQSSYTSDGSFRSRTSSYRSETGQFHAVVHRLSLSFPILVLLRSRHHN